MRGHMSGRVLNGVLGALLGTIAAAPALAAPEAAGYEAEARGFRMRVVGCLTCDQPVQTVAGKRFLTLKVPTRDADTMGAGVTLVRPAVPFDDAKEARAWEKTVKPNLRAEYVFKAAATEWTYKDNRGVAFEPVAMRVYDRCTGH